MSANWQNRTLFHGDNLPFMRAMNSESVDLIATDPPFNKGRDFHATPDSLADGASFQDRWSWETDVHQEWVDQITDDHPKLMEAIESARYAHSDGMGAFMCFMAVRLLAMRRLLKPTGSIYLHCDPTASHYLKACMDAIFGWNKFISQVIWNRAQVKGNSRKKLAANHDLFLVYKKGRSCTFNSIYGPQSEEYTARFKYDDSDGRGPYRLAPLDSPALRPNLIYEYKGYPPPKQGWRVSPEVMKELDADRRLAFPKSPQGRIARKHYLNEQHGPQIGDVWTDIGPLQSGQERLGYPTQKPLALYERIIEAGTAGGG